MHLKSDLNRGLRKVLPGSLPSMGNANTRDRQEPLSSGETIKCEHADIKKEPMQQVRHVRGTLSKLRYRDLSIVISLSLVAKRPLTNK